MRWFIYFRHNVYSRLRRIEWHEPHLPPMHDGAIVLAICLVPGSR